MFRPLEKLSKKPVLKWEPFSTCFYPWGHAGQLAGAPELMKLYSCGEGTVLLYTESLSTPLTLPRCIPGEGYQVILMP